MSALVSAPLAVLPHLLALGRRIRQVFRTFENRRAVNELAELSDAALHDIGLARNDVDAALAAPLFEDPTLHLASLNSRRAPSLARRPMPAPRHETLSGGAARCA